MLFFILRPSATCIEKQKEAFRSQIRIALELKLPLVIHCRDAEEDCWDIMVEVRLHLHNSNMISVLLIYFLFLQHHKGSYRRLKIFNSLFTSTGNAMT